MLSNLKNLVWMISLAAGSMALSGCAVVDPAMDVAGTTMCIGSLLSLCP